MKNFFLFDVVMDISTLPFNGVQGQLENQVYCVTDIVLRSGRGLLMTRRCFGC